MDENLYRCLKHLEASAQALIFALPQEGSEAYKALKLLPMEWKYGALIDHLCWLGEKTRKAATAVYMEGKE